MTEKSTETDDVNTKGGDRIETTRVRGYVAQSKLYIQGEYDNLNLVSVAGQKFSIDKAGQGIIDLDAYAAGTYIVTLTHNGQPFTTKIIIK